MFRPVSSARALIGAGVVFASLCLAASAWSQTTPAPAAAPTPAATSAPVAAPTPQPPPPAAGAGAQTLAPNPDTGDKPSTGEAVELASHPAALIEVKANRDEIFTSIFASIAKLRQEIDKAGLKPAGNPIAVFLEADDAGFKYRAEIPLVAAPEGKTELSDVVKIGQTPVGKTMRFQHRGAYDDIDGTYEAITAYLDEKGIDAQDVFIEEYLNETKTSDDPNLQVDIYVLVK